MWNLLYNLVHLVTNIKEMLTLAILWFRGGPKLQDKIPKDANQDWIWCYTTLISTSTSFSALCLQLHEDVRGVICLFYMILRGLDTVEDDMQPPIADKKKQLLEFFSHLEDPGWKLSGYGENKSESELLENFHIVIRCFMDLQPEYREIISDICQRMGSGMAEFLERPILSLQDWTLYCQYVAGLTGEGLTRIWLESGIIGFSDLGHSHEKPTAPKSLELLSSGHSVGLLLQKAHIIRDLKKDVRDFPTKIFWPEEIWTKYVNKIQDFLPQNNASHIDDQIVKNSLNCLNELIRNAFQHIRPCMAFLHGMKSLTISQDSTIFRFSAVPMLMSIATLELCYNNYDVFLGSVKVPKVEALRIMQTANNYTSVLELIEKYACKLQSKIKLSIRKDPENYAYKQFGFEVKELLALCAKYRKTIKIYTK